VDKDLKFGEQEVKHYTEEEAEALLDKIGLEPITSSVIFYIEPKKEEEDTTLEMESLENEHRGGRKYIKILAAAENCLKVKKGDYVIPRFQFHENGVYMPPTKPLMIDDCFYHVLEEHQLLAIVKNPPL